jgi:peptide/nickel transport system ATP-binding protein
MNALDPVMRVSDQIAEAIRLHEPAIDRKGVDERIAELFGYVGISPARARQYPHEFSGGMRQRVMIALALACRPELIVMDEPTTAVDVVMQRQILAQVLRLRREFDFAVVFVTHDLSLLLELADRIAVMYAGRIVELASAQDLYRTPMHPYTRGLRDSFPPLHAPLERLEGIPGTPPDLRALPSGCPFAPRCPAVMERCHEHLPLLTPRGERSVACHLHDEELVR